jgi:hypothetical protein
LNCPNFFIPQRANVSTPLEERFTTARRSLQCPLRAMQRGAKVLPHHASSSIAVFLGEALSIMVGLMFGDFGGILLSRWAALNKKMFLF